MTGKPVPVDSRQPPATPPAKPKPAPTPLTHDQQSVYDLMLSTLRSWGLESLGADLKKLVVGGDTAPETLALALSQTDAYKKRFVGNDARRKAGLAELNPAQYIALEEGYRNIAHQYGIPDGYLDKSTTDKMIGGDVSTAEAQDRLQAAADIVWHSGPEAQQAWDQFYGGGPGGVIASMLDPTKAAPLVERQAAATQIGGAALSQGLTTSRGNAERFAAEGVTLDQARRAYSDIATRLPTDTAVGSRFGTHFGQSEEEAATIEGSASALQQQNSLYAQEASLFGGHGGGSAATGDQGSNY